ncbi:hypothetical protein HMPREF0972_00067 [Actinomyces sp. oral taxon 848 str. F0332]|nr:hypothetical protein HMPREF0972_00067 [Actinomyces sp. oral taxon 848 str. F0332]
MTYTTFLIAAAADVVHAAPADVGARGSKAPGAPNDNGWRRRRTSPARRAHTPNG